MQEWPAWLERHLRLWRIDALVMFGQSRPVHELARRVATELGIDVYVFEEGYLRPHYVTLEHGGVNGYSRLPRHPSYYTDRLPEAVPPPQATHPRFHVLACYACLYLLAMLLAWPRYRRHVYHRSMHPVVQAVCWIRGGVRKLLHAVRDRGMLEHLTSPSLSQRWFLFPLQVHNDAQLLHHSRYRDMQAAIDEVLVSFAAHAPGDARLVLKHHPMDRPYTNYRRFIDDQVSRHGLGGRVHYVDDLHLPTLLKHTRGVVTVNSTTGMQALFHGTPVHTLGDCLYALPGLVHDQPLDTFWNDPGGVDRFLYEQFRQHLVTHTQLNASFHGLCPALATARLKSAEEREPMRRPRPTADAHAGAPIGRRAALRAGVWPEDAAVAATFEAFGPLQTLAAAVAAPGSPEELLHKSARHALPIGRARTDRSDPLHPHPTTHEPWSARMAGAT